MIAENVNESNYDMIFRIGREIELLKLIIRENRNAINRIGMGFVF
jgi:hypothetical protein